MPDTPDLPASDAGTCVAPPLAVDADPTRALPLLEELQSQSAAILTALAQARRDLVPLLRAAASGTDPDEEVASLLKVLDDPAALVDALWILSVRRLCEHAEHIFAPASGVPLTINPRQRRHSARV
jgi:hypothetical protein